MGQEQYYLKAGCSSFEMEQEAGRQPGFITIPKEDGERKVLKDISIFLVDNYYPYEEHRTPLFLFAIA